MKTFLIATLAVTLALVLGLVLRSPKPGHATPTASTSAIARTPQADGAPIAPVPMTPAAQRLLRQANVPAPSALTDGVLRAKSPFNQGLLLKLSAVIALGDIVSENPGLSDEAILALVMEQTRLPRDEAEVLVANYPRSEARSLDEHYRNTMAKPEVQAVVQAFERAGVQAAPGTPLLIDGLRLCSLHTLHDEFVTRMWDDAMHPPEDMASIPGLADEAARVANERVEGLQLIDSVFKERFITRHQMEPGVAQALLAELWPVRVALASEGDLHPPRLVGR
jgi:hypothetical protein